MATKLLFVYGTLKRGLRNNHLLAGQEFLSAAHTLPYYRLYDHGPHPCLVEDRRRAVAVRGEIWRVEDTAFACLDEFEGVPDLFVRREIKVEGISTPVFAYFFQGDISAMTDCGDAWPPGAHGACS
jgi:gamma-glutamylcyclotransferase (GGCT)/AIG2-like uncharacterized protein YtfP